MKLLVASLFLVSLMSTRFVMGGGAPAAAETNLRKHHKRRRDLAGRDAIKWSASVHEPNEATGDFVRAQDYLGGVLYANEVNQNEKWKDDAEPMEPAASCSDDSYGMCPANYHCECTCEEAATPSSTTTENEHVASTTHNEHVSTTEEQLPTDTTTTSPGVNQVVPITTTTSTEAEPTAATDTPVSIATTSTSLPHDDTCRTTDGTFLGTLGGRCNYPVEDKLDVLIPPVCCLIRSQPSCAAICNDCDYYQIVTHECCHVDNHGEEGECKFCCRRKSDFACVEQESDCTRM
jgi:hypothetical protein